MQKKSINFYYQNEKKTFDKNKNKEQNNNDDKNYEKYSKNQLTEAKTYNKNKMNSPYIFDKKNFFKNNDNKNFDNQYIYESGDKMHYFKNNTFNARNTSNLNPKSHTYYNNEKKENYYSDIQNKIYKKVVEQIFNNLYKYCKKLISNEYSKFLKNLKIIQLQNESKPKTYKKKYISDKNIYKAKKTPDRFNLNKKHIENIISPLHNYKKIKTENDNFISQKTSVNNSSKKNVIYSNYYNLNFFENNTNNNKYIYSSKRSKPKISNEFSYSDKTSVSQKDINIIPNINFAKDDEIINNEINTYEKRKNIIKTSLRKNNNINLTQPKNYQNFNSIGKNTLKIDSKNSITYINYSTKKKMIDKLQNIKLFRQVDNNDSYKNLDSDNLDNKKIYFQNLMKKLKVIAFFKHIEKSIQLINNKNKLELFEILKKYEINIENSENISSENDINKEKDNINENVDENNNSPEDKNIIIKEKSNSKEEEVENQKEIEINNQNIEVDNTHDSKNIEINNGKAEEQINEEDVNNKIKDKNEKDKEILNDKLNENKDIINENNLELDHQIISDEKLINEVENIEENHREENEVINNENNKDNTNGIIKEKIEDININSHQKENKNEIETMKDTFKQNSEELNNSINNKKNEEGKNDINYKNNEEEKDNQINIINGDNYSNIKEELNENEVAKRNITFKNIFEIFLLKEKNIILKGSFFKWKQIINANNNLKEIDEAKNEIVDLVKENKEEKRNHLKIKTLFLDEVDDEEKEVILEEMVFRFRTLLMSTCFQEKESFSDSFD